MVYNYIFLVWNFVVMLVYGIDKLRAKRKKRRISESALLLLAFFLGGIGAIFGMVIFNHKTSKPKFRFFVPFAAIFSTWVMYIVTGGDLR